MHQQQDFFLSDSGFICWSRHILMPGVVSVIYPCSMRVMMLLATFRKAPSTLP